jgi:hypothetical protein
VDGVGLFFENCFWFYSVIVWFCMNFSSGCGDGSLKNSNNS